MKKIFAYNVGNEEVRDTEAWGEAWKWAKETAAAKHLPIFRFDITEDATKFYVYCKGGVFLRIDLVTADRYFIF